MKKIEELDYAVGQEEGPYKTSLKWCEKYLLRQGPLEYFVHHNTLHSFEEYEFFEAIYKAKSLFQATTHMPISWYIDHFNTGRINSQDLEFAIKKHLDGDLKYPNLLKWSENWQAPHNPLREAFLDSYIQKVPDDNFYQITTFWDYTFDSFRSKSLKENLEGLKFKFLSAFFDKGTAYWEMEDRDLGFHHCFKEFLHYLPKTKANSFIQKSFKLLNYQQDNLEEVLEKFQEELGIPLHYLDKALFQVLNETKGWTGLVYALTENQNFNPTNININKDDYVAFCLVFELAAYLNLQETENIDVIQYKRVTPHDFQREILIFLYEEKKAERLSDEKVQKYFFENRKELLLWDLKVLNHLWQEAYEHHLYQSLVDNHARVSTKEKKTPKLQVVTCIDDREESTRRHFEEFDPSIQTFGYAGHFGFNIKYRSLREAHYRALCPLSAKAEKYVYEEALPGEDLNFKYLANTKHFLFHNSNLPLLGSFLSLILGPFTGMLFLMESFAPRLVHSLRKKLKKVMFPPVKTQLNYWKRENGGPEGFSDTELANVGEAMINIIGLKDNFGEVILICGHGSKSMNNPHGAAYNCGACSGGKGAPNARLMATALNKAAVRVILKERGIAIPETTTFVGGYHCTSTGKILVFEDQPLEENAKTFLMKAKIYVEQKDAKERMRKFENVSLDVSDQDAFLAAQNRSYDFSQPRPEYGHNTNAFCLVGNRETSKDIFFDRRAFLVSYQDELDPDGKNLLGLLSAVIPVCAGISLEYYFSYVDIEKFGAGVKQGHNVNALMGVMNGYQSDLQIGLPWQMVEIHEPARISFLIETSQEKFESVLKANKEVSHLVLNEWVRVILKDQNGNYLLYGNNGITKIQPTLEKAKTFAKSEDIYLGTRELLDLALKGENV